MKKILLTTILILGLSTLSIYAQNTDIPNTETATANEENTNTNEESNDTTITDEEIEAETQKQIEEGTLSQDIQITETQHYSFLTILFAILTPVLLILVAYLLIKMSNK
jgi:hypothetical protein